MYTYLVNENTLVDITEDQLQALILEVGKPPRKWQFRAQLEKYLKSIALTSEQVQAYQGSTTKGYLTEDRIIGLFKHFRQEKMPMTGTSPDSPHWAKNRKSFKKWAKPKNKFHMTPAESLKEIEEENRVKAEQEKAEQEKIKALQEKYSYPPYV